MRKALLLAVLVLASLSQPARAQFCPGVSPWVFDDVAASDPFCGFITWMAENGITLGCQTIDANHRLYCPSDNVTRKQMAAFMNRLGNVRVEAVDTGPGLTGGPITSVGTINLATTQLLPTTACATNQIAKWNGSAWTCANQATGTGTVTSVTAGAGLTGGTITTSGTIAVDTGVVQSRVSGVCAAGSSIRAISSNGTVTCQPDNVGPANAYEQGGNAFGATAVLGTTDNNALDVRVNGARVMRYEPSAISPNVVGGSPANSVKAGVRGAAIGGGGVPSGDTDPDYTGEAPNRVTDHYGTVGGGYANVAGSDDATLANAGFATVGGGSSNAASGAFSTLGGGFDNEASGIYSTVGGGNQHAGTGNYSTVGGGDRNTASGVASTVGGGGLNIAGGFASTIGGGANNSASGSHASVVGGTLNIATGDYGTVLGGRDNVAGGDYSVAMGRNAKALGQGSFSFADSNAFDFNSATQNAFRVRATGGVRFVTDIDGTGTTTWSCLAVAGASWSCSSDRNLKHSLVELDGEAVLKKLAAMPVYQWQPKGQNTHVKHYGPMAQDFHAAFGLGDDDKMIGFQDADGVALAAIKGLNAKVESQAHEIDAQRAEIAALRREHAREIASLRLAVEALLARTAPEGVQAAVLSSR